MSEEPTIITAEEKRAMLMEGLLLADWPQDIATEVVDLSMHACDASLATMLRISETGSHELVKLQVMLIAGDLIMSKLKMAQDDYEEDNDDGVASLEELREAKGVVSDV